MFKSVVVVVAKQAQSRPAVSRFEMQPRNLVLKGQGGVDRRDASDAGVGESGGGSKGSNDPQAFSRCALCGDHDGQESNVPDIVANGVEFTSQSRGKRVFGIYADFYVTCAAVSHFTTLFFPSTTIKGASATCVYPRLSLVNKLVFLLGYQTFRLPIEEKKGCRKLDCIVSRDNDTKSIPIRPPSATPYQALISFLHIPYLTFQT